MGALGEVAEVKLEAEVLTLTTRSRVFLPGSGFMGWLSEYARVQSLPEPELRITQPSPIPDLCEALKECVAAIQIAYMHRGDDRYPEHVVRALELSSAALAKAKG